MMDKLATIDIDDDPEATMQQINPEGANMSMNMAKIKSQNTIKNFQELTQQEKETQNHKLKQQQRYTPYDNPEILLHYYARRGRKLYEKFEADSKNEGWLRVFDE